MEQQPIHQGDRGPHLIQQPGNAADHLVRRDSMAAFADPAGDPRMVEIGALQVVTNAWRIGTQACCNGGRSKSGARRFGDGGELSNPMGPAQLTLLQGEIVVGREAIAAAVERLRPCMDTVTMAVTNRCAEAIGYTHCQPRLPSGLPPSALPLAAPVSTAAGKTSSKPLSTGCWRATSRASCIGCSSAVLRARRHRPSWRVH